MSHIDDYRFTKPSTKVMRGSLTAQLYKQIYEPLNRACTVITTMSWWLGETRDDRGGLRVTLMERKVKWNFDIKKQWFVMSPSLRSPSPPTWRLTLYAASALWSFWRQSRKSVEVHLAICRKQRVFIYFIFHASLHFYYVGYYDMSGKVKFY